MQKDFFKNWTNAFWVGFAALIVLSQSFFILDQTQQALVVQLGNVKDEIREPGLKFKWPLIQNIVVYDKRVLNVAPPGEEVLLADQKRSVVDAYARYRITNPLQFFQKLGSEDRANERIGAALRSALRSEMAKVTQTDMLSEKRETVMNAIRDVVNEQMGAYGVGIIDVRIRAADLPKEVQASVFGLMESQRRQEAALIRAQGAETAARIKAEADKERTILLAEAERDAQVLRGQGDQAASKISADSYGQDPEFYSFYRSMQAYRDTLGSPDTTLLIAPDGDFFHYFKNSKPSAAEKIQR